MATSLKREKIYWLGVLPHDSFDMNNVANEFGKVNISYQTLSNGTLLAQLSSNWEEDWKMLASTAKSIANEIYKVSIIPSDSMPDMNQVEVYAQSPESVNIMADNYWLIDYLDKIESHFQKIENRNKESFGYESFARITREDKSIISGGKIMQASEALNIKHIVDRLLLNEAVRSYAKANLKGALFLNFVPGFIHKPEKYLEGLDETVKEYGVKPQNIVFDINKIGDGENISHLVKMADYCRENGYKLSLDDVSSVEIAEKLMNELRPDIIKLDKDVVKMVGSNHGDILISRLINLAHSRGCMVLAEGIETEEAYNFLYSNKVDLFQGYLIGKPEKVL